MTQYRYSIKKDEKMAVARGAGLPISTKASVEICSAIRGKNVQKAKRYLENVIAMKDAVPYKRYNKNVPHQKGIGPGRFPVKAAGQILKVLKSAESNAKNKGFNTNDLVIVHTNAHLAERSWRYGRHSRRLNKRTHVEFALAEIKQEKPEKKTKKVAKND